MLECRACVLRCIRAIAGDTVQTQHVRQTRLLLTPSLTRPIRRAASTALATKQDGIAELEKSSAFPKSGKLSNYKERDLKVELKYLGDPVKLAEHVHYTLRCNKPEKALDLCRLASKQEEVIVSWNHCVDWYMSQGKIDDAIKIYNEMKKRAQFPDSYTYIHLLRGLARPHHHGQPVREANVARAVSIYNSLSAPNSRVKPSILHTNAVLKVCSEALDMDALWGIAGKLPKSGPGAPDHITYAILLNAIRHGAFGKDPDNTIVEKISAMKTAAVQDGRRIWQEIVGKWRAGEIHIDEELVCAMGRLLLISSRMQDWDDVLNLVQQTMNIERQIPPLGDPNRNTEHVPQISDAPEAEPEAEDSEGYKDTPAVKAFKSVGPLAPDSAHPKRPTSLSWVKPDNSTLNMLIGACTLMRTPKTASAYWDLLTSDPYGLKPDIANFHALFRLLNKSRASARAVSILKEGMSAASVRPKNQTFRMVMSICLRDKKNPHTLDHARTVIDVMEASSSDPDVHTLSQYLQLALLTDNGAKIVAALDRLDSIVHNLKSRISYGADETNLSPEEHALDKEEGVRFLQTMVGAIDILLHRGLVPREEYSHWHGRRGQLTQFIGRASNNLERQKTRLDREKATRAKAKINDEDEQGEHSRTHFEYQTRKPENGGRRKAEIRMSKTEWTVKTMKWRAAKERRREEERIRVVGLQKWRRKGMDGKKEERRGDGQTDGGGGFADLPGELG